MRGVDGASESLSELSPASGARNLTVFLDFLVTFTLGLEDERSFDVALVRFLDFFFFDFGLVGAFESLPTTDLLFWAAEVELGSG